ncbi:hypothetical protein [Cytobacillus sp. BC1816]|uniref:hypothetical protein n=1 Tax=Cytobacillus sp. BC1816 TaxID=3440154 RepID=UPI003F511DE3
MPNGERIEAQVELDTKDIINQNLNFLIDLEEIKYVDLFSFAFKEKISGFGLKNTLIIRPNRI